MNRSFTNINLYSHRADTVARGTRDLRFSDTSRHSTADTGNRYVRSDKHMKSNSRNSGLLVLLSCLLLCSRDSYGQRRMEVADSLKVQAHWRKFVEIIQLSDKNQFRKESLSKINCSYCTFYLSNQENVPISIDTFVVKYFDKIFDSKMLSVMSSDVPWISEQAPNGIRKGRLFEVIYLKYRSPVEHGNLTVFFDFLETSDGLKFYGYDTAP